MRYEDASGTFQVSGPIANDDSDTLTAGSRGPATGNLITGEGTQYGSAGADSAADAHVTTIAGKGGEDSSFAGGKLSVSGEFGQLSVDAEGNYSYLANTGAPENVRDRFIYTLADGQGNSDTAALVVEIGKTPVVIKAGAQQVVPGPDGVVTLPPGVELSDIMVVGRNLVVNLPDGTQLIIVDGAVFVPQLVLGGVEVPATNVAALLIGQEVQPAAGEALPSSGGNFAVSPPPLDPGVPLGDLLPPTELTYNPPEPREVLPDLLNRDPEVTIRPDGQPAAVNAVDSVDEAGLPERNEGEPEGSGEEAAAGDNGDPSEATSGTIIIDSPDGVDSVTIAGADGVPHEIVVGLVVQGEFGTLTITGTIGNDFTYSYVLNDNTSGDDTQDDFEVVLTDDDGDTATATLTIDIIDDVPTARPDTDAIAAGQFGPATGNVITDASAGDAGDTDSGADTVGADDADLTAVTGFGSTTPMEGGWTVIGQYGVLTISNDGSYSYVRNPGTPGGVNDVFNYTLTDGDGDISTTTLTISIEDAAPNLPDPAAVLLDDDALAGGNAGGTGDNVDSQGTPGQLIGSGGDGDLDYAFTGLNTLPAGFAVNVVNDGQIQVVQGATVVLTITLDNETGSYTVVQNNPIDHPDGGDENDVQFSIGVQVEDEDGEVEPATITINVDDDTPTVDVSLATDSEPTLQTQDAETDGDPKHQDTANTNFAVAFTFNSSAGADGAAAPVVSYALGISAPGVDSGLDQGGANIYLHLVGGVVVGSTSADSAGVNPGNTVFSVSVDSNGKVTLTQFSQVDHPSAGDPSPTGSIFTDHIVSLSDTLVTLTATASITDADGDTATDSQLLNIGANILIRDDGPDAVDDSASQTTENSAVTVNVFANDAPGADGVNLVSGIAVVPGSLTGAGVLVYNNDGSFTYTPAPGEEGSVTFQYRITDFDGDTDTGTVTIAINDNDVPTVDAPNVGEAGTVVDETGLPSRSGEPEGTGEAAAAGANGDASETTAGVINFGGGDGATTITINGVTVTGAAGQTFAGDYGTLTITGFNPGGTISYSYTLADNVDHDSDASPFEEFDIVVSDGDGDPADDATDTLRIDIINDAPIARDDTDSVVEGASTDGNVLTGVGATSGAAGADTPGADGYAPSTVVGVVAGDSEANVTNGSGVGVMVAGTYGNLVLNANGGYTYTSTAADPPEGAIDRFTYTIIDNDGNASNAELIISVIDDLTPTVDVPTQGEAGTQVDEKGLPPRGETPGTGEAADGNPNNESDDSEITSGTINFTPGDEPATVTIDGVAVAAGVDIVGDYGTLHIDTFNAATGVITYTYTLADNVDHDSDATPVETFTVTVTDGDNDADSSDLVINIVNDAPIARDDTDSVVEGASTDGNVLTGAGTTSGGTGADTPGADGYAANTVVGVVTGGNDAVDTNNPGTVGVGIVGTYGTLTLNANGGYSYTANPGSNPPPGATDTFTYTIIDKDGNLDSATLTISLVDDLTPTAITPAMVIVDDDDVPGAGGNPGSPGVNDDAPQNLNGFVTGSGGDGDLDFHFNVAATGAGLPAGFALDPASTSSNLLINQGGTLVLTVTLNNETGAYTVTQNAPIDHAAGSLENNQDFNLVFYAQDADGDQSPTANLTVRVDDDTPIANDDSDTIASGGNSASGNVLTGLGTNEGTGNANSDGADGGGAVVGVAAGDTNANLNSPATVGSSIAGTYGSLTLNADGSYTYTRTDGTPGNAQDVFTYTFIDGDGDMVNATLTIQIQDASPLANTPAAVLVDDDDVTSEEGNPGGTGDAEPANTAGFLTGTGGDGDLDFFFDVAATGAGLPAGFTVDPASTSSNMMILQGGTLVLTITLNTETGAYSVTQNNSIDHAVVAGENNLAALINVAFYAQDADGDQSPRANLAIDVDDDTPTLGTIEDGTANNLPGSATSSGELNFSVGADSPGDVVSITANNAGITSGGKALVTNFNGATNTLTAYQDANGNGSYDAGDTIAVYTLTVDPGAGVDGEWVFDLINPLDPTVISTPIGGASSFGAGPTESQVLEHTDGTDLAVVSGYKTGAGFNEATWLATGNSSGLTLSSVNGSESGWGVANNNFEGTNEFFNWDFGPGPLDTQGGTFTPPAGVSLPQVSFATFDFINYTGGDDIKYVVHFTDGTFASGTIPSVHFDGSSNNSATHWTFTAPAGKFIADIEMYTSGAGPGKVDLVSVGVQSSDLDKTIDFDVTLEDSDGDQVSGGFSVNVADGNTPSMALAATSFMAEEEQLQKSSANSNTLTMAAAVAAAGMAESAAASPPAGDQSLQVESDTGVSNQQVEMQLVDGGDEGATTVSSMPETAKIQPGSAKSGSRGRSDEHRSDNELDNASARQSSGEKGTHEAANDHGPELSNAAHSPVAPDVAMVSAEMLVAAGRTGGTAKDDDMVEKILVDALGHGGAPTVDGLLAQLPGGLAQLAALSDAASPAAGNVPGWDIAHVGSGFAAQMMFKLDAAMVQHHDAVHPVING